MIWYLSCWLQSQPPTLCDNYLEKTRQVGLTGARETIELPIKIWFVPASVDLHNPFCSYVLSTQTYLHNFSHDVFVCGKTNILLWDSGLLSQRIAPLFSYFLVLYCTVYIRPAITKLSAQAVWLRWWMATYLYPYILSTYAPLLNPFMRREVWANSPLS